ncbi:DUF2207 domain-containing protein [Streptococcus macacae]|uniref:Membrane protein, PF09972 family n=1 Tax=Streptococcus macacae NCTC 11558 TaxID=764298 RepID=G5JVB0_9STRE|nr:DUF2207 domain-containing protein [Streptococcus macacae]EHJ53324.1 hypothetical protein STRMA_1822 [Streptococcus macacae NCTC 11558]SUN77737.1 hypothetical membrane spanning protein [Streptococcus macacae NCTC 11558]
MKKILACLILCFSLLATNLVQADDIEYSVSLYKGKLTLHQDNTATFQQDIVYDFDSAYNGQYVTLGTAGNVPKGFRVDRNPEVSAYGVQKGNLKPRSITRQVEKVSKGYRVKVYNGGKSGDRVVLSVKWKLHHVTKLYSDIAELNWKPVSDWETSLKKVILTVKGPTDSLTNSKLYAHTGYFKKQPQVSRKGNQYRISLNNLGEGKPLELHAYWQRSDFTAASDSSSKKLQKFQALEKKIAQRQKFYPLLVGGILPLAIFMLLLISLVLYLTWKSVLGQKKTSKRLHLFAPPEDLPPLVLARYVYGLEVKELSPLASKHKRYDLGFKELIQAGILDLVDQGKILISDDQASFVVSDPNKLEAYEQSFLTFVYGKENMPIDSAFADYKVDKSIFKGGSETEVRQRGQKILDLFKGRMDSLDKAIEEKIEELGLVSVHRQRTKEEKRLLGLAYLFVVLSFLSALGLGIFALVKGYWLGLGVNALIVLLSLIFCVSYYTKDDYYKVSGILTEEGLSLKQGWDSFENMIRDIKKFDKVELEGIIVWNRILVYATLYGYAERIQNYLKLNRIELENPQMTTYLDVNSSYYIGLSTAYLSTYTSTATSASNFSVSSGSSGGSGGFSGGGGGGGGGAF